MPSPSHTPVLDAPTGSAASSPVASNGERAAAPARYRGDIQGLRAVASLLVATFHMWVGGISGGVDVFFVVTGFLITTTLFGNVSRTGAPQVGAFLTRLAGRLLPLAGIVLLAVSLLVLLAFPQFQWPETFREVFAAAVYGENWQLAHQATDYLARNNAKSPVQHFWAMSVQGQFYVIWAIVFLGIAAIHRRRPGRSLRVLAVRSIGLVSVLSAAWALAQIILNPVVAYYDTFARLWEFGVGALIALWLPGRVLGAAFRWAAGLAGLALLLTAGLAPADWHYPGPVALWPVAAAALLLLSHQPGAERPGPVTRLLSSPPMVRLGGLSYGIYLWSWPLLVAYFIVFPQEETVGLAGGLALLAASVALAWLSIRGLARFDARRRARLEQREEAVSRARRHVSPLASLVPLAAVLGLVMPFIVSQQVANRAPVHFWTQAQLSQEIDASLGARALPVLAPGFGTQARAPEWTEGGCATVTPQTASACRFSDGDDPQGLVFVVGDSHAVSWAPGIREALGGRATVQLLGREMCALSTARIETEWQGVDADAECQAHNQWVVDLIRQEQPDLVVVSMGMWQGDRVRDSLGGNDGMHVFAEGARPWLEAIVGTGARTVVLDSPPSTAFVPSRCATTRSPDLIPETCSFPLLPQTLVRIDTLHRVALESGAEWVDDLWWFCSPDTYTCPGFVDGMAVQADGLHLTWGMSRALAPLLDEALGLDVFDRA